MVEMVVRTDTKRNPNMTPSPGIEPGPYWWEANALTTARTTSWQTIIFGIKTTKFKLRVMFLIVRSSVVINCIAIT